MVLGTYNHYLQHPSRSRDLVLPGNSRFYRRRDMRYVVAYEIVRTIVHSTPCRSFFKVQKMEPFNSSAMFYPQEWLHCAS